MKEIPTPRKLPAGRRRSSDAIPHLPMEWMDPMSWRLPSGKALAEFALQAGFLAPLIMSGPRLKKKQTFYCGSPAPPAETPLRREEVPERSGTFRRLR
jgi:hypothetical protein